MKNKILKIKSKLDKFMLLSKKENKEATIKLVQVYNRLVNKRKVYNFVSLEKYS